MSDSSDVETLRRLFAEEHAWDELLRDTAFWRKASQLPADEQARACVARLHALGITEPEAVTKLRIEQMGLVAALIDKIGLDDALEKLRPKQH